MRTIIILCCVLFGVAHATPGGVNKDGCHKPKSGAYHCHPERAKSGGSVPALTQEERRLTRECKGRPNAGACAGYARK